MRAFVLLSVLSMSLACGGPAPATAESVDRTATKGAPVIEPGVGVGPIRLGMSRAEVEAAIGPGASTESGAGGVSLGYDGRGLAMYLVGDKVVSIQVFAKSADAPRRAAFVGSTAKGIHVGCVRADLLNAYGPPKEEKRLTNKTVSYWDGLTVHFNGDFEVTYMAIAALAEPK